jgi:hypothetical protein
METYQRIDEGMQKGYQLLQEGKQLEGCDQWLETWGEIKALLEQGVAHDIYDLDKKCNLMQFISNYVQDLEMELHNAGIDDSAYHVKRIKYCKELLQWCGEEELIISNTRHAIAESYFQTGEAAMCDQLYTEWLKEDINWGWGYIGWSDCYQYTHINKDYEKAEEILLTGYNREGLRDKADVAERLIALYEDMGKPEKAKEYKKNNAALQRMAAEGSKHHKAAPVRVEKVGRNDPCPCGSGKKYKRCCGSSAS